MATETPKRATRFIIPFLLSVLLALFIWRGQLMPGVAPQVVAYSELVSAVDEDKVQELEIRGDEMVAKLKPENAQSPKSILAKRLPNVEDTALLAKLAEHKVKVTGKSEQNSVWVSLLVGVVPFLLIPLAFWLLSGVLARRAGGGRPMSFGKSQAKIYDKRKENQTTFSDVAGVDEARGELTEVVSYLKDPSKYRAVGARVPKGVLLVGPPGTGKTLLARAVAGESGVPFFSMSGSEFVEMFVGVGASRVRDLFEQAKERAPCIIFIDELDAIGKSRAGGTGFVANEEREQTLNQLLVEMDGFDSGVGIVIMAATNRPEILDKALLRAGRFDRQVVVDRPDVRGREAILVVHARKVQLAPDVELKVVAQRTPGMVGADLANVVNEAALASVRRGGTSVTEADFDEAVDRIQLGLKKEGRVMTPDEKRRVAFHEAGHALVALSVEHSDPVHRVTIIPRSIGSLGATLMLPTEERYLMTREELYDRICVMLGGRSAEEIACQEISTGAEDDLARATELARLMVTRFGMSDKLGAQTYGKAMMLRFTQEGAAQERDYSEETARTIDAEVTAILEREHARALKLIEARRKALDAIGGELLEHETLQRDGLEALVKKNS